MDKPHLLWKLTISFTFGEDTSNKETRLSHSSCLTSIRLARRESEANKLVSLATKATSSTTCAFKTVAQLSAVSKPETENVGNDCIQNKKNTDL